MFEPATDSRWAIGIQDFKWENDEQRGVIVMGTGQPQNPKNDKSNTKERKARSVKQPAVGRQNPVLTMKMMYVVDNADGC